MMAKDQAKLAPILPRRRSVEDLTSELHQTLTEKFCLAPIPTYSVFVEGWTDVHYLQRAAQLVLEHNGEDLLEVPLPNGEAERIAILTPGIPGNPSRGGVPQLERLARALEVHVFHLGLYAVCFLLDHDDAGVGVRNNICQMSYRHGSHALTLNTNPKDKIKFNNKDELVIEDLLPIELQLRFFEQCDSKTCLVTYNSGRIQRIQWDGDSKGQLQQFACVEGTRDDFALIANVLYRIRGAFNLPLSGRPPR